ncbi:MAG: 3-phosphoserine/phosphohydroxythreonine transaminase [Candidatus Lambdaproteobacteria bacterium]|nr:3-phosphoserine/phosphohydroxythreonine transaminase [Candidatus Lambdaproteobacteria bacterium]
MQFRQRVYNFSPGPAMLPLPVMKQVQEELLNWRGMGASIIEISHRSKEFEAVLDETEALLRELMRIPNNYKVVFVSGGGQMQFSVVPLNLIALKPARKALFAQSGNFSQRARDEAKKYGTVLDVASSEDTRFDRIPQVPPAAELPRDASFFLITTNNTIMGTQWHTFPDTGEIPLVGDATSELLSREIDVTKFGLVFAGAQKNLGPAGFSVDIVREDLLGKQLPDTPKLLNLAQLASERSLTSTPNTFAIYVVNLVLHWLKEQGGVKAIQKVNEQKAALIYAVLDASKFYKGYALKESRSNMNVTFNLPTPALVETFCADALKAGLYALKGHRYKGGIRASIYNAMPLEGAQALVQFMKEFERTHG